MARLMVCISRPRPPTQQSGRSPSTVEAGATVGDVVKELKQHGLTLENFASINEQQLGGFTQVGCHGTGPHIPPCDEQVLSMSLVTPGCGTLRVERNDPLFRFAAVGLGCLGVVHTLTMRVVPNTPLIEKTRVLRRKEVVAQHEQLIASNKHLRYMWIPYSDAVVVVTCNPMFVPDFVLYELIMLVHLSFEMHSQSQVACRNWHKSLKFSCV